MTNSDTKNFSQNVSSSYHLEDRGKCNKNTCANTCNVPKLRFKGYNDEWKKVKLKDICIDFIVPMRDKPKEFNGNIPWCRIEDIEGNYFNGTKSNQYVSQKTIDEMNLKIIPTGSVICSCSASLGTYAINTCPIITNQTFIGLVCSEKISNHFLLNLMNTQTRKLKVIAGGTTIPYISREKFEEYNIKMPQKEEQEKIASFLTLIDKKIEKQKEFVELLKKYKRGLLSSIFSQKLRFKDNNGNDYPAWEEKYIQDVCSITTGKGNTQDKEENGIYPFYVRSPIVEKSNKYIFDGEAVLTVGDGVGTGKVFHYVNGKFNFHQRVYKMSNFSGINGRYFYYYFSTHFYDRVKRMTAKTSVDSVRMEMITKMPIFIPTNAEQDKIINLLTNIENIFLKNEENLFSLQEYKKGLLQQMFI